MKRALLLLAALVSALPLLAGEPFFCTRPGTRLHYERYKVKSNKLTQTTLFEIESNLESASGREVHYAVTMKKANGKELFGGRTRQMVTIAPNGDLAFNFGQTVKSFVQNMFPGIKVSIKESVALLPENIQPGDTLPDIHCMGKVMAFSVSFDVTDRTVLRRERITTPAGTYDCLVVRERKQESSYIHHRDNWQDNYYVSGLGYVRHDVIDSNMQLQESEVLIRIENSDVLLAASDGRQ